MDSKFFKLLLCLVVIVLFTLVLIGYEKNLVRNILIGVGIFAFAVASWEMIRDHNDNDHFPSV